MILARTIRAARQSRRETAAQVATRAKVSRGALSNLEHGHARNPSIDVLGRVALALAFDDAEIAAIVREAGRR